MSDFLNERRRGAEEAFFAKQNEALLAQMRQMLLTKPSRQALAQASGIKSDSVLDHLVDLSVGNEGAAALSLIPLIAVAWADGELSPKEHAALLTAADAAGLARDSAGFKLFEGWLRDQPPTALLQRWKEYAGALMKNMDEEAKGDFRSEILTRARSVAEAAGGFLGIGRVSAAEADVLSQLDDALQG